MLRGQAQADRRAVVEYVDGEAIQFQHFGETGDHACEIGEGVLKAVVRWRIGTAEAWQVGRDDVKTVGQLGNQVAEHVAAAWKAVQQQERRQGLCAGFPIENIQSVYFYFAMCDLAHVDLLE